jgi:hypothetical protein
MKTAEEVRALTGWIAQFEAKFDGSVEDEFAQGFVQAHQDLAMENKRFDVFDIESIGRWSRAYAIGYEAGKSSANKTFASLQSKKGFPSDKGFSATAVYGRAR